MFAVFAYGFGVGSADNNTSNVTTAFAFTASVATVIPVDGPSATTTPSIFDVPVT